MPDGKTHTSMTVFAAGATAVVMWRLHYPAPVLFDVVEGCLTGIAMSPDLDVDGGFIGFGVLEKYFGVIVAKAWRIFWWPYAQLVPHRSWVSHAPVISTLIRVSYAYLFYFVIASALRLPVWMPGWEEAGHRFAGLLISDVLHFFADIISTSLKKRSHASLSFPMSEMSTRRRTVARIRRATPNQTQRLRRSTN